MQALTLTRGCTNNLSYITYNNTLDNTTDNNTQVRNLVSKSGGYVWVNVNGGIVTQSQWCGEQSGESIRCNHLAIDISSEVCQWEYVVSISIVKLWLKLCWRTLQIKI